MEIEDAPQLNNSEDRQIVLIPNWFRLVPKNQKHQNQMIGSNDSLTD